MKKLKNSGKTKKHYSVILLWLLSFWWISCTQFPVSSPSTGSKPTPTQPNIPSSKPVENTNNSSQQIVIPNLSNKVVIQPDYSKQYVPNPNLISFNTGFLFTAPIETEPAVKTITQILRPKALRFPGGTLANYYHPDGKGYGFRQEDVKGGFPEITRAMALFDKNAIYHFTTVCKMANSQVVYVANLMTGTVDETLWALDYFKSQNIQVIGVELGNEFYLTQYRKYFPTVESYIQKAKEYASAIRKKYPQMKLGVVAADPTEANPQGSYQKFQNLWNATLGKEIFYDFYIPHLYSNVSTCEKKGGDDLKAVFGCTDLTLAPEYYHYHQIVLEHYKSFYGNKKMWVTEWNVDAASTVANTIRHAEFVGESLMGLIDLCAKNNELEYAFFHNYGSGGYAAPLFTYTQQQKVNYLKREGNIAYNSTYFPFLYFRELLNLEALRMDEKISYPQNITVKNVVFKTFVSKDKSSIFLYFINKSAEKIAFEVKGAKEIKKIEGIQGKYPWSLAGLNGFYKTLPNMVDMIQYIPNKKDAKDFSVPGYSVGYLEIAL
ncbi:MAG: hypothetical protein M9958_06480 [Chitinophagales bacterium]|nr:hypothetical protein [Chitinophagales bacterium]